MFQLAVVNVRLAGRAVPSPGLLEEMGIVTSDVGAVSSTTVNWAVPPASVVAKRDVGLTVIPVRRAPPPRDWTPPVRGIVMLRRKAPLRL